MKTLRLPSLVPKSATERGFLHLIKLLVVCLLRVCSEPRLNIGLQRWRGGSGRGRRWRGDGGRGRRWRGGGGLRRELGIWRGGGGRGRRWRGGGGRDRRWWRRRIGERHGWRWWREDERAAIDKMAMAWGFRELWKRGEEEGDEWEHLREWVAARGMILDKTESTQYLGGAAPRFDHRMHLRDVKCMPT